MSKKNTVKDSTNIEFERDLQSFFSDEDHVRIRELEATIVSLSVRIEGMNRIIETFKRKQNLRGIYSLHNMDFDKEMGYTEDEGNI